MISDRLGIQVFIYLIKSIFIFFIIISEIHADICHEQTGWCYVQSTSQAFYMFSEVTIGEHEVVAGEWEGTPPGECLFNDCDVVAAFNGETCVSWSFYYNINDVFTLVLMGADGMTAGTENYLHNGDYPSFKIYQAETGYYYNAVIESGIPMFTNFGNSLSEQLEAEEDSNGNILLIESINNINDFRLFDPYPNPFNSILKIEYFIDDLNPISINIQAIDGQKIFTDVINSNQIGLNTLQIELNKIPSGIYFISLKTLDSIKSKKIILLK